MKKYSVFALALGFVALTSIAAQSAEAKNWKNGQFCGTGNLGANYGTTSLGANYGYGAGYGANCGPGQFNNNNRFGYNNGFFNNQFRGNNNLWNGTSIDNRQARLAAQIQQGISSGRLSQREANRLLSQQQKINDLEARFRANNNLSFSERARLQAQLNSLSMKLRNDMRDRNFF